MSQDNSQLELSGIQLRESRTQPRVSLSREIGEAVVTETIFGRAKVRIIRKHDKMRRALWLGGAVAAAAIGAVVWQGWYAPQPAVEPQQSADSQFSAGSDVQAGGTLSVAEPVVPPVIVPSVSDVSPQPLGASPSMPKRIAPKANVETRAVESAPMKPVVPVQGKPLLAEQKPLSVPAKPAVALPKPIPVQPEASPGLPKQAASQSLPAVKSPVAAPLAAGTGTLQLPAKPLPTRQFVASPRIAPASSPVAIVPLTAPLAKEDQLPVVDKPLSDPLNAAGK